jgi:hypothetical protein
MQIFSKSVNKIEEILEEDKIYLCMECQAKPAEIFQINGEYCLDCWQDITHTRP